MNINDTKIGETYLLPVTVTTIQKSGWIEVATCNDYEYRLAPSEVKTLLQNGIKNTVPAPKYAPCRLFKKGDVVRVVKNKGRKLECSGSLATVKKDEDENKVLITIDGSGIWWVDAAYLELVTPVEELEPYYVSTNIDCSTCTIFKRVGEKKLVYSAYYFVYGKGCTNAIMSINEAQAEAEAECARLNEECRKEHSV